MERLTIEYDGHYVPKELCTIDRLGGADDCEPCHEDCDKDCSKCAVQKCFDKLAEYEDLEEQGLLKKQLYKEGQLVWCVDEYEYSGLLFVGTCGEYVMVVPEFVHCATDFDRQLEEMCEESQEDLTNDIKIYHKDRVYPTRVEAQAALEKMKNEALL